MKVVVVPEARSDVEVRIIKANPNLPLYIRRYGDTVLVDVGVTVAVGVTVTVGVLVAVGVRVAVGVGVDVDAPAGSSNVK